MKRTLLNRNENLHGPAPECMRVLKLFDVDHAKRYLDGYEESILIPEIAKKFGVDQDRIILGYGAEDLLRMVFNKLNPNEDSVLTNDLHFTYYDAYLNKADIELHTFDSKRTESSFAFDMDTFLEAYSKQQSRVVLITSPNNPTGHTISAEDLRTILKAVNKDTIVVLDEAYYGFYEDYDEHAFLDLVKEYPQLMIIRSFSKLYSLAGLRIGFAFCGKAAKDYLGYQAYYLGFSRVLEEVAVAALKAKKYYKQTAKKIISEREEFIADVNELDIAHAYASKANMVFVELDPEIVEDIKKYLDKAKTTIAKFVTETGIRVSLSSPKDTKALIKQLQKQNKRTAY